MTEKEWQEQVTQLAAFNGWRWLHVRKSIGTRNGGRGWQTTTNVDGWPDLFLWHERDHRCIAVELKVGRNKTTPAQDEVLESLLAAGIPTFVWYPEHLETVATVLARPRRTAVSSSDAPPYAPEEP